MDKKEIEKLEDLSVMSKTPGGIFLITSSKQTCINIIEQISNNYSSMNEVEIKTLCSKLNANLSMYQLLTGIDNQVESIKELLKPEE